MEYLYKDNLENHQFHAVWESKLKFCSYTPLANISQSHEIKRLLSTEIRGGQAILLMIQTITASSESNCCYKIKQRLGKCSNQHFPFYIEFRDLIFPIMEILQHHRYSISTVLFVSVYFINSNITLMWRNLNQIVVPREGFKRVSVHDRDDSFR